MKAVKRLFGDRKFYLMVLGLAVPVMIQNGITNFVSLLDNIMVGRLGTEQMSGVAIVNQLVFVFNLCVFGAVSGVSIFSSQYFGRRDWDGMRNSFRLKLIICLILTIAAIGVLAGFGDRLVSYYLQSGENEGDVAETFEFGMQYLKIMLVGLVPFAVSQVYSSALREMGQTRIPMLAGVAAVAVNLLFNWLLIFGKCGFPELGVGGAAIATVLSRYVEVLIVILWTHLHAEQYIFIRGVYSSLHVPAELIKAVAVKGTPLMVNEALWSSGMAMLTQCYSMRGLSVVAALNIASTITNLFNVVYIALGSSIGIVVGPQLGAGEMDEARDTAAKMITFSVSCCFIIGALMFILAPLFPRMYNTTDSVRSIATTIMRTTACFLPIFAFEHATYFTLRAGGKTIITFLFDSAFTWVLVVPLAYVLSRFTSLNIYAMYICVNLLDLIKCTIGFILVKKGVWVNRIVE